MINKGKLNVCGFFQRPYEHIDCSKCCYETFPEAHYYAVTKSTDSEYKTQSILNFSTLWTSAVTLVTLQRFQNI